MRVLFLTNLYPPVSLGGYEQWCQEVAQALVRRGHQLCVLTTRSPSGNREYESTGVRVCRTLQPEVEHGLVHTTLRLLAHHRDSERENLEQVNELVARFRPEVAVIWGMWNIPRSVPALVERLLPGAVAYYLMDYWLSLPSAYVQRWQVSSRRKLTQLPKRLLAKYFLSRLAKEPLVQLETEHPICVSRAVRRLLVETGVAVGHARVIYGGIQADNFLALRGSGNRANPRHLRLLYLGRLEPEKGVHTAIKAVSRLILANRSTVTLDLFGRGDPDYVAKLQRLVKQNHLEGHVFLRGYVLHNQVPTVLAEHDTLIFPSEWEEPFARTILEAMAAGLVVIGTTTGGSGEILVEDRTGLTFPAGDAGLLASQIQQLQSDPTLQKRLAEAGQRCVVENFSFTRMVDQLEEAIQHHSPGNITGLATS
jgi:glycogen synthase